jgi:Lrp/AsnC family leucine-responsive transcriptional regulator
MVVDSQDWRANLLVSAVIDELDDHILKILSKNGRESFAKLGSRVGLSPHGAADRVRRLERAGVITGYEARIDSGKVGRVLDAFIDVRLLPSTSPEDFERIATALPAVRELAFLTGRFDYQLRVACRDAEELDTTVRAIRRDAGAAGTETRIVMRCAGLAGFAARNSQSRG